MTRETGRWSYCCRSEALGDRDTRRPVSRSAGASPIGAGASVSYCPSESEPLAPCGQTATEVTFISHLHGAAPDPGSACRTHSSRSGLAFLTPAVNGHAYRWTGPADAGGLPGTFGVSPEISDWGLHSPS